MLLFPNVVVCRIAALERPGLFIPPAFLGALFWLTFAQPKLRGSGFLTNENFVFIFILKLQGWD